MLSKMQNFFFDLRQVGIPLTASQVEDCYQALLKIDWSIEEVFRTALFCTLVKDSALLPFFHEVYRRHFHSFWGESHTEKEQVMQELMLSLTQGQGSQGEGENGEGSLGSSPSLKPKLRTKTEANRFKDPFVQSFYAATYEDLKKMEAVIPILAKRLAAKMRMKKKKRLKAVLDYRSTLRRSMATGGVPVELVVKKKSKEKPVIFALCDVSVSCLEFSTFSLALVYSLEHFFRQVRSFAFIGETDEITNILRSGSYQALRTRVIDEANVVGATGYTNYGHALVTFLERYGKDLSHKSSILIFGDARTNWYRSETWVLKELKNRVKRIVWFNPEPRSEWNTGDSVMNDYAKHCHQVFSCTNLEELTQAILRLQ